METESFTKVSNRLIRSENVGPYATAVFIAISHFNPSFPSLSRLSRMCKMSRPTVVKSIKILVEMNVITINRNTRKSNEYIINAEKHWDLASKGGLLATPHCGVKEVYSTSKGGLPALVKEVYSNKTKLTRLTNNTNLKEEPLPETEVNKAIKNILEENYTQGH